MVNKYKHYYRKVNYSVITILLLLSFSTFAECNWELVYAGTVNTLYDVSYYKDSSGNIIAYAVGANGTIVKTTDGGENWELLTHDSLQGHNIFSVYANEKFIILGSRERVFRSNDGINWMPVYLGGQIGNGSPIGGIGTEARVVYGIDFTEDGSVGYIVANGSVFKTVDEGLNWSLFDSIPNTTLLTVAIPKDGDGSIVYAGGSAGKLRKIYGSGLQADSSVNKNIINSRQFFGMYFMSEDSGFLVGNINQFTTASEVLFKTTNGCNTLDTLYLNDNSTGQYSFYDISFSDKDNARIVGTNGNAFVTEDGGTNWNQVFLGSVSTLRSICMYGDNKGITVGDNGSVVICKEIIPPSEDPDDTTSTDTTQSDTLMIANMIDYKYIETYPNPFSERLTVRWDKTTANPVSFVLFDIYGREVKRIDSVLSNPFVISGESLNNGLYILNINLDDRHLISRRLIVE